MNCYLNHQKYYFNNIIIHNVSYCGIFSVDKRDILQHSVEYYKKLITQLSNSSNPEVGHYFERSWCAVFYPMNNTLKSYDFIHNRNKKINRVTRAIQFNHFKGRQQINMKLI
jgi:hypothetical protein